MKKYYPIFIAKSGELTALKNLTAVVKQEITPIVQIIDGSMAKVAAFAQNWNHIDNEIFLDFSLLSIFVRLDAENLMLNLQTNGLNIVPVVQSSSSTNYMLLVADLLSRNIIDKVCIRFTTNGGGFLNINNEIAVIKSHLGIPNKEVSVLLDFGFIRTSSYNSISSGSTNVINSITNRNTFENIIVATGSFPDNLGSLTPPGIVHRLPRLEWDMWNYLQLQNGITDTIKYSDYGTKHPVYNPNANYQGSCSIKYTVEDEYVIFRGELSQNHPDGNGQYITFSNTLVSSPDYWGSTRSFGDERIDFYSRELLTNPNRKTGNSTTWVEISQNHHCEYLPTLL